MSASSISTSARTCVSVKPCCWMALLGQVAAQVPQPVQSASLITATPLRGSRVMAS